MLKILKLILIGIVVFYGVTAYKVISRPSMYLSNAEVKDKYGDVKNNPDAAFYSIIRLKNKNNDFFCSAFVLDGKYAMTAAHCVVSLDEGDDIRIYDRNDTFTGTVAKVLGYNTRNDNAVITGDFRNFKAVSIEKDRQGFVGSTGPFMTCGYPYGQRSLYCSYALPVEMENFSMRLTGALIPGMSGGPVFDLNTKKVIALNTAVDGKFIVVNPIVGALAAYGIDQ